MLYRVSEFKDRPIRAADGDIGSVQDLLFDDESWTVRWLVIDTGGWLSGRTVLIPASKLGKADAVRREIEVDLTRREVKESPDVDMARPVSRSAERSFHSHFALAPYWYTPAVAAGTGMGTPVAAPMIPPRGPLPPAAPTGAAEMAAPTAGADSEEPLREDELHLRSAREVSGYYIEANNGDIGHVEDFLVDEDDWSIRYFIIDTKNWWPGKLVLIPPSTAEEVRWSDSTIRMKCTREDIKRAPEFNPTQPIDHYPVLALYTR